MPPLRIARREGSPLSVRYLDTLIPAKAGIRLQGVVLSIRRPGLAPGPISKPILPFRLTGLVMDPGVRACALAGVTRASN